MTEIKDHTTHDVNEGKSDMTNKKEKTKEKHGSIFEATIGITIKKGRLNKSCTTNYGSLYSLFERDL